MGEIGLLSLLRYFAPKREENGSKIHPNGRAKSCSLLASIRFCFFHLWWRERGEENPPPHPFQNSSSVQPRPWILLGSDPIGPVTQQGSQSLDKGKLVHFFLSPPRPAQERRKGLTPVLTDSFCLPRRPKTVYYAGLRQKERQESLCQNGRKEDP